MIDADHFKRLNDEFGHSVGDEALKLIATVLRRGLVGSGIVSRYGGEEFVCVTSLSGGAQALEHLEKIREGVASIELIANGNRVPLSVSIGVTTSLGSCFADMIELADQAVYQAKESGRNRVVELSPENSELPD